MVGPLFLQSYSVVAQSSLSDTRWISLQWIIKNIPFGSVIAREHYTPPVEDYTNLYKVKRLGITGYFKHHSEIDGNINVDYVIFSSEDYGRFFDGTKRYEDQAKLYSEFFDNHTLVYEQKSDTKQLSGPAIRIYKIKKPLAKSGDSVPSSVD